MKTTLTRSQAHNLIMQHQKLHPDCLNSKAKWESYPDKPFGWDIIEWCKYSPNAIKCTNIAYYLNILFLNYNIHPNIILNIWKNIISLMAMINEKREIYFH